jgi:hypothetical protein
MTFTRNVWFDRLFVEFHRFTQLLRLATGPPGAACCDVVVVVVVPDVVVPVSVPVVAVVALVVVFVALAFLLSSPELTISSAARNPTAIASTAMSHVLVPRRSIAAAR